MTREAPSDLSVEEYRALRATIRQRGTARLVTAAAIFVSWGSLTIAVQALLSAGPWMLVPLVVLSGGFEVIFALHTGVERIGRYLQVYYEDARAGTPAWEDSAMRFGPPAPPSPVALDPLFGLPFASAALLNLIGVGVLGARQGAAMPELSAQLLVCGLLHGAFITRLWRARRFSQRQRQTDLARFKTLRGGGS